MMEVVGGAGLEEKGRGVNGGGGDGGGWRLLRALTHHQQQPSGGGRGDPRISQKSSCY